MGRTVISRIARCEALDDDDQRRRGEVEEPESLPQNKERLKDAEWIKVFQYLDANKPCTQRQVVDHFERKGLRFSRKTLARKIIVRDKIERRVADAAQEREGTQLHSDGEMTSTRGQIAGGRPKEGMKTLKSKDAAARQTSGRGQSPDRSSRVNTHSPVASPTGTLGRRSSRRSRPPQASPPLRVRRSTRLEKAPQRRFVDPDSEYFSPSSSSSDVEEEDSDDDFAETDEDDPPFHQARLTSPPRFSAVTRPSSHMEPRKNVANTSHNQVPFVLVTTRSIAPKEHLLPASERDLDAQVNPSHISGFKAIARALRTRNPKKAPIDDPEPMIITPWMSPSAGVEASHSDGDNGCKAGTSSPAPADNLRSRRETPPFPDEELETCILAPRLKRKRKKLHDRQEAARLGDQTLSPAQAVQEKRIRLTPTPVPSDSSPFTSPPGTGSTPSCGSATFASSPTQPELPLPLPLAGSPVVLGSRAKLESELEQRGCRPNLWDAWIP